MRATNVMRKRKKRKAKKENTRSLCIDACSIYESGIENASQRAASYKISDGTKRQRESLTAHFCGCSYYLDRSSRSPLGKEISAKFTGLVLQSRVSRSSNDAEVTYSRRRLGNHSRFCDEGKKIARERRRGSRVSTWATELTRVFLRTMK